MMRLLAAVFGLCIALPAAAQNIITIRGTSPTGYMLDGQDAATAAYSLRRLITTYTTNQLVILRRTSDNALATIGFDATGAIDTTTASTHCSAGADPCFVTTWYDQIGSRNLVQATAGSQPAFIFNCLGTSPCVRFTSSSMTLVSASNITPATGVVSFAVVASRPAGTGACGFLRENATNNVIGANGGANTWRMTGGGGGAFNATAADGPFYSGIGVMNGASSKIYINSTVTNGTSTGNTTAAAPLMIGSPSTTCQIVSGIIEDNVVLSATAAAMITANQRAWFGF